jgi:hypothetical protein
MRKNICVAAIAVALVISPATMAQQVDPPKQSLSAKIKEKYLERRAKLVRRVKDISFAVGCKILPGDAKTGSPARESYLASVRAQAILDLKEDEELVKEAIQAGLDRASKPDACDYYRRHPEAAEAIRRASSEMAKE